MEQREWQTVCKFFQYRCCLKTAVRMEIVLRHTTEAPWLSTLFRHFRGPSSSHLTSVNHVLPDSPRLGAVLGPAGAVAGPCGQFPAAAHCRCRWRSRLHAGGASCSLLPCQSQRNLTAPPSNFPFPSLSSPPLLPIPQNWLAKDKLARDNIGNPPAVRACGCGNPVLLLVLYLL